MANSEKNCVSTLMKGQNSTIFDVITVIGTIQQLIRIRFEEQLPRGMRLSQFSVLNHFAHLGGEQTPGELASALRVTKGAITNTVQLLGARGLLEVTPHQQDGRSKRIRITAAGYHLRNEAISALSPIIKQLQDEFSIQQFAETLPFLERFQVFLDTATTTSPD